MVRPQLILALAGIVAAAAAVSAEGPAPAPDWVPSIELSYTDPVTGAEVVCGEPCRRFSIPDGVELVVRVAVANLGADGGVDGPPWDLWLDQRRHPFPGLDLAPCLNDAGGEVDLGCWQDLMRRVDWADWEALPADLSCVPEEPDACASVTLRIPVNAAFEGSRGRGVYSISVWADRFQSTVESDEFNSFTGPVRVTVEERAGREAAGGAVGTAVPSMVVSRDGGGTFVLGARGRPFNLAVLEETLDTGFALGTPRSEGRLEFVVGHPGRVSIEMDQIGSWENVVVEVRKVATGAVIKEARGRGRLQIEGTIGPEDLKGDRRFAVVVTPAQGSRGVRGTIRVTYPSRVRLIAERTSASGAAD